MCDLREIIILELENAAVAAGYYAHRVHTRRVNVRPTVESSMRLSITAGYAHVAVVGGTDRHL